MRYRISKADGASRGGAEVTPVNATPSSTALTPAENRR